MHVSNGATSHFEFVQLVNARSGTVLEDPRAKRLFSSLKSSYMAAEKRMHVPPFGALTYVEEAGPTNDTTHAPAEMHGVRRTA